jgi:hypothetical protein
VKLASQPFPPAKLSNSLSAAPLFSGSYKSLVTSAQAAVPFFSATYKSLFAQPLSFHIDLNPPGVDPVASLYTGPMSFASLSVSHAYMVVFSMAWRLLVALASLFRRPVLYFQQLAASFCKMGGVGYTPATVFAFSANLCVIFFFGFLSAFCINGQSYCRSVKILAN